LMHTKTHLVTSGGDGTALVSDLATLECVEQYRNIHEGVCWNVKMDDMKLLTAGDEDHLAKMFDRKTTQVCIQFMWVMRLIICIGSYAIRRSF